MKVYLAGDFFDEENKGPNWRRELVEGIDDIPYTSTNVGRRWGILENAILGCFDYTGPFPAHYEQNFRAAYVFKEAIKDTDMVFVWTENLSPIEIGKVSTEITYARCLDKLVVFGSPESDFGQSNIWFPIKFYDDFVITSSGDDLRSIFVDGFNKLIRYFSPYKIQEFKNKNNQAQALIGSYTDKYGYIYLIKAETGHYKIGRTKNIPKRMNLFSVKLPFKFEIIHTFLAENMYMAETDLHNLFSGCRANGEWFNLSEQAVNFIKKINHYSVICEEEWIAGFYDASDLSLDSEMHELPDK